MRLFFQSKRFCFLRTNFFKKILFTMERFDTLLLFILLNLCILYKRKTFQWKRGGVVLVKRCANEQKDGETTKQLFVFLLGGELNGTYDRSSKHLNRITFCD